jgi:type IV pilus modification protein PilV
MKIHMAYHQEKGFSLLEVLVAILLIALGIVTMVMLQGKALQYSSAAFYQGHGMQVANGLAASARANPQGVSSYTHTGVFPDPVPLTPPANDCSSSACNPAQMAAADIFWARRSVGQLLPNGDVFTRVDGDFMEVTLVWIGGTNDGINLPCGGFSGVVNVGGTANVQCLQLRVRI